MGCQHKSTLCSPAAHPTWEVAYSSHFSYMHWKENVSREPISGVLSALRKLLFVFFVKPVFITGSTNKKQLQISQLHFIFLSKYLYFTLRFVKNRSVFTDFNLRYYHAIYLFISLFTITISF